MIDSIEFIFIIHVRQKKMSPQGCKKGWPLPHSHRGINLGINLGLGATLKKTTNFSLNSNANSNVNFGKTPKRSASSSCGDDDDYVPDCSFPLGHPLPLDEHACSVSLPTWASVVGYEEGVPEVTGKMACGYPRFVYHPYVLRIMDIALKLDSKEQEKLSSPSSSSPLSSDDWDCIVLPSRDSALRCHDFLVKACGYFDGRALSPRIPSDDHNHNRHIIGNARVRLFSKDNALPPPPIAPLSNITDDYDANIPIRVLNLDACGVHAVIFPAETVFAIEAKSYWQHTGEVVSSRRAETALIKMFGGLPCNTESHDLFHLPRVTTSFYESDDNLSDEKKNSNWKTCPFSKEPHLVMYEHDNDGASAGAGDDSNQIETTGDFASIQERIASIVGTDTSSVFLTPSGMASIYGALRSARRREIMSSTSDSGGGGNGNGNSNGGKAVVFGFPYLDTLKMCSRPELVPGGVEFFGHGNAQDLANLEQMLKDRRKQKERNEDDNASGNGNGSDVSVLITEYPSNPLLNCADMLKLRALADEYDFALVVDDTIGNFANVDLINSGLADAICTSLTKLFNGRGDAIAGSIVTNPNTKIGRWMQQDLEQYHSDYEGLWKGDARAVNLNSVNFLERSTKINETSEALADWLKDRDEIASIYYPKFTSPDGYNSVLNKNTYGGKHTAGYGGLMSIVLHPHICQRTFYDKINLSKGPSLGTNFSLACPYTLLAHYHELDFAMSYDVEPNLLRFAVGLEDLDVLKEKFDFAFKESKLHPKLPVLAVPDAAGSNKSLARGYCTQTTPMQSLPNPCKPNLWTTNSLPLATRSNHRVQSLPRTMRNKRGLCSSASILSFEPSHLGAFGYNVLRKNVPMLCRKIR